MESWSTHAIPRRRFLQIAVGAAGLTLTVACSGGGGQSAKPAATSGAAAGATTAPASGTSGQGSIRIALFGSRSDADRRAALIPPFNAKFPNVKVEYTPIQGTDWEEFFSKVLTMKMANAIRAMVDSVLSIKTQDRLNG